MNYASHRVLIVDDQAFVRRIVMTLLKQIGFNDIYESGDGSQAMQRLAEIEIDLVVCDIEMAPMDGLSFLRLLRERYATRCPRFIFLTCHGDAAMVKQARDLGVDAFVLKPVNLDQLRRRVDHVMGKDAVRLAMR